ncbi:Subunit of heteropentameric Replication factor C (RF-C) [Phytophthora boehmeriae]|uniref:Subunit of heteropentameric Replication factor C (RF-C) n=1 Tax=Phytophthora boehmeriae TaxID=109152 RepID=A0A8T1WZX4_9STRA|nr:Subunit of heteropentameric Replication factor C (RF-C) [Phytophthora boehmeriae]
MLWVDKYRPTSLSSLDFHPEVTKRLSNLSQSSDLPHLLVYGPSGAGKKTRIMALLRALYGDGALKVRLEHKSFKVPNRSTKVEITTVASNFHIEMNPSDVGTNDRLVVQEVLKEIAQYHLADTNARRPFKVVLLMEVDRLSKNAQHALRRTMEKYTATCRLVLCCNNPSKVIDPLRSRCLGVRVGAPSTDEICNILQGVCSKEGLTYCDPLGRDIANKSERNLRRALLMLETCRVQNYPFSPDQQIQLPAWEDYICSLAKVVLQEQSPAGLLKAREMIYELISNCVPSEVILKVLCRELMSRLDDDLKHELVQWASYYEHRMQRGSKDIFHFEAFLAKFMTLYKKFLLDLYM